MSGEDSFLGRPDSSNSNSSPPYEGTRNKMDTIHEQDISESDLYMKSADMEYRTPVRSERLTRVSVPHLPMLPEGTGESLSEATTPDGVNPGAKLSPVLLSSRPYPLEPHGEVEIELDDFDLHLHDNGLYNLKSEDLKRRKSEMTSGLSILSYFSYSI
jgi:hypothetical protein